MFCWNCLVVHLVFTCFLLIKWIMNTFVYRTVERCWFDMNGQPKIEIDEDGDEPDGTQLKIILENSFVTCHFRHLY